MPATGRLILATWSGYLPTGSATEYLVPATYPLPPAAVTEYLVLAAPHLPLATETRGPRPNTSTQDPGTKSWPLLLTQWAVVGSHFGFSTNSKLTPQLFDRDRGTPFSSSGQRGKHTETRTRFYEIYFLKIFLRKFHGNNFHESADELKLLQLWLVSEEGAV